MEISEQPDVFISYTGSDEAWATWLDFLLREAGYKTTVQVYDFLPGKSFVDAMDQALKTCQLMLSLLSPAYLASRWCKEEWQSALATGKLFLLRIADCRLDGILAPHAYLDLVGVAEHEAKTRILAGLAKLRGQNPRPDAAPTFPGESSAQFAPPFPGRLPSIWNITQERNPYFTGRDQALEQLHTALTTGKTAALTQTIKGLGAMPFG
jgi:hypothetical protein